jgi:pSer/pThr/pTyr-binding forkhead associated (FHA) protein
MIRCAECNEENMDGLEYCDSCGAKLEAAAAEGADAAEAAPAATEEAPVDEAAAPEVSDSVDEAPAEVVQEVAAAAPEAAEEATAAAPIADEPIAEESVPVSAPAPEPAAPVTPAAASGQTAKLTVMRGGTVGKEFPLQAGDNLIGRWDPDSGSFPEVDLESDDTEARISRKHALIRFGDTITIEDIGSLNGTFVNRGQRLEPGSPATLKDGDEIIIGKTFFKVAVV